MTKYKHYNRFGSTKDLENLFDKKTRDYDREAYKEYRDFLKMEKAGHELEQDLDLQNKRAQLLKMKGK